MAASAFEYELEFLPELGSAQESHELSGEGESESEQFFGALANLAKQGAGWLTASGSPQRRFALWAARKALTQGLPAAGRWAGTQIGGSANGATGAQWGRQAASALGSLLPQQENEFELEGELNPVRKWYPDAMLEHIGHAAAETESEAEAQALAGAMIPLAARAVPAAAPSLLRAAPALVCSVAGVTRALRQNPGTKPLVRVMPAIVRRAAKSLARQSAGGNPVSPQPAVRILANETAKLLGTRGQAAQAFRNSQTLDRQFHKAAGLRAGKAGCGCGCGKCNGSGAKAR